MGDFMLRFIATSLLLSTLMYSGFSAAAPDPACRVIDYARIDTAEQLARLENVCEIRKSLAIFTSGVSEIVLPNLKKVGLINVEADGLQALALPALESARDIYLTGSELQVAELPALHTVSGRLVIQQANLEYLRFPELRRVGRFILFNCPSLKFIFVDKLYDIASIRIDNAASLNPACEEKLRSVTRVLSPEERAFLQKAQQDMRDFKRQLIENTLSQPPIRPTGHPTKFDSFGMMKSYYQWYPYEYDRFHGFIGPWGYSWIYTLP